MQRYAPIIEGELKITLPYDSEFNKEFMQAVYPEKDMSAKFLPLCLGQFNLGSAVVTEVSQISCYLERKEVTYTFRFSS